MFIVAYTALYVSMSSIGAEGKSIMNLYQVPLVTKDFVIGKVVPPIIFGSCVGVAFYVISEFIVSRAFASVVPLFLLLSVGIAFEMSLLGLWLGMRFPNFSESPRLLSCRRQPGLLALPCAALIGGISLSPVLITSVFNLGYSDILGGFVASIAGIGVVDYLFYWFSLRQASKLLSQIPI